MGRWDRDFKVIGRLRPLDLLGLVPGIRAGATARSLEKELASAPPLPRALDQLVEIEEPGGARTAFQLEFEAEPRSDTAERVFDHWAYAHLVLGRVIRCVVFYMSRGSAGRRPQSRFVAGRGRTAVRFSFETVCFWELEADAMLASEAPGLWALSSLGNGAGRRQVENACRLLEGLGDESLGSELLGVWYEVAGLLMPSPDLLAMVRRKELLMESSTYKAILEQGIEQGGKIMLTRVCRELIESRLGSLPPEADSIGALDIERLTRLSTN
jgi:hypothetical protein